jgi:ATP-dependent helicase/nuclease subunit A
MRVAAMREEANIGARKMASVPPDQMERSRALDPEQSFLVQAPAGSGKTYLLTQRFLRLLAQAEKPDEIVAITFTNAAAAEMRNRILDALEKAEGEPLQDGDTESLPRLAAKALNQSKRLGWQILEQPGQLRITTIDAFCRGLALQSPLSWGGLLSGLGGRLDPVSNPEELYRRAATRTIELLKTGDSATRRSVEALMLWRDNHWKDVEELIVKMLAERNRWYQEFVFARDGDWAALRQRLEAPFRRTVRGQLEKLGSMMDRLDGSREFALSLARFACENPGKSSPLSLAERAELPALLAAEERSDDPLELADAAEAYRDLACFLLTAKGEWRKKGGLNVNNGFPATTAGKAGKDRFGAFVDGLAEEPGLLTALASFLRPMPVRYTDEEWGLIQHFLAVLRFAAGQLQVVFSETGSVDFTEVAQIALRILAPEQGFPSDFAIRQADSIRHLLIDEFQDTSRSQHVLLSSLIAAWPEREGRSCFCVGDPMQSIYGFREAEVELFERTRTHGLEVSSGLDASPLRLEFVPLRANFRTVPSLVEDLNRRFEQIFAEDDGSGVRFFPAEPARESQSVAKTEVHVTFMPAGKLGNTNLTFDDGEATRQSQLAEIVALIQSKFAAGKQMGAKQYRIAVLGRAKNSLIRIAEALSEAGIGYRAIELVPLGKRPEVVDAISLARAVLNPTDRTAWLGVLRAPWCGLSLEELHLLTSADDAGISSTPVSALLESRLPMLFDQGKLGARGFAAASRVERVLRKTVETRSSAGSAALGTWLESVWKALGGSDTVNAEQRGNLRLLWAALDGLPHGELDLLGPGLNAALDKLCALPDPAASAEFGVQLMTIHKSKGLEFEVVIVPDLEAEGRKSEKTMISWLERGLADSAEEAGSLTEFLIAPIPPKGADAGAAKQWVDGVKHERERQELRRLLYVAATRAREELHLFARPRFRVNAKSGEAALANPTGLLATAWPAVGDEIEARFAAWIDAKAAENNAEDRSVLSLAASARDSNLIAMPGGRALWNAPLRRPTMLRRLPEGYASGESLRLGGPSSSSRVADEVPAGDGQDEVNSRALYERHEGGLQSRVLGTAIHGFLEELSRLRREIGAAEAAEAVIRSLPATVAKIRSAGYPRAAAEQLAGEALAVAQQASAHPIGAWILTPHPEAETETRWTGVMREQPAEQTGNGCGRMLNLRPDRVFFSPAAAGIESPELGQSSDGAIGGAPVWWIIDYKSSHAAGTDFEDAPEREAFLAAHRKLHLGQLTAYARVLRNLRERQDGQPLRIRTAIFYPRLLYLDWWEA